MFNLWICQGWNFPVSFSCILSFNFLQTYISSLIFFPFSLSWIRNLDKACYTYVRSKMSKQFPHLNLKSQERVEHEPVGFELWDVVKPMTKPSCLSTYGLYKTTPPPVSLWRTAQKRAIASLFFFVSKLHNVTVDLVFEQFWRHHNDIMPKNLRLRLKFPPACEDIYIYITN